MRRSGAATALTMTIAATGLLLGGCPLGEVNGTTAPVTPQPDVSTIGLVVKDVYGGKAGRRSARLTSGRTVSPRIVAKKLVYCW